MSEDEPEERPWKRIARLTLLLYLVTPVGLWMLWQDKTLNGAAKWRLLFYLFLLPALIYATVSLWLANKTFQQFL